MLRRILGYALLATVLVAVLGLLWLRWDAGRPRDAWFAQRQGTIAAAHVVTQALPGDQLADAVSLTASSGLQVSFRVIRPAGHQGRLPVLVVLGGHRTGSDAVELFGNVGARAVVGIDYPYDGPDRVRGFFPALRAISPARRAFLDTVPAVSLVLDWLEEQEWVEGGRIVLIGASLGAPFATTAARRDPRVAGLVLVHAAADNRLWMQVQVARRIETRVLHYPLSVLLHWLAYGPVLDTGRYIADIAPRPVLVINASRDERTPAEQGRLLFAAAGEPKRLRITDGRHVQPGRREIVAELLWIADEEMAFLIGDD